ncbi:MAG: hypothetical protein NC212_04495 [Staphylococcus sp.]|nr:hypothetical protein [Staphylococcus sp.]
MLRKQLISLLLLLTTLPVSLLAQLPTGSWKVYPTFGAPGRVIDTDQFVYVATSGTLHSYDKANDESRDYEPQVDLSGNRVKDIYYNFSKNYLVVVYEDASMDILPDDGERICLPDIRDANLSTAKGINDVRFDDGHIYVATTFGLVVYNDETFEVKESGIYNVNVSHVFPTADNIVIVTNPAEWIYNALSSPKSERHHRLDKFRHLFQFPLQPYDIIPLSEPNRTEGTRYAVRSLGNRIFRVIVQPDGNSATCVETDITGATDLFATTDGAYVIADGAMIHLTAPWNVSREASLPEILSGNALAAADGLGSVWAADVTGLANYSVAADGSVTVLSDRRRPAGATSFSDISNIFPINGGRDGFLTSNLGLSLNFAIGTGDFLTSTFTGDRIADGRISAIEVNGPLTIKSEPGLESARKYGEHIFSPTFVLEDPDDPSIHYIGSGIEGVYVIKDGKEIGRFDSSNSPMNKTNNWAWRTCNGMIDDDGNLIIAVYTGNASLSPLIILPADKRRKDPGTISASDWVSLNLGKAISSRDVVFVLCKNSPVIIADDARDTSGFSALYHRGTLTDPSDDVAVVMGSLIDQDGKNFNPQYTLCFTEDQRGRVWAGTTQGIYEIASPTGIFTSDFHVNRLKVPRNDGTNLADYLLESEKIYCIAVDPSNRKWIGTADSGAYLVSENGDEVLANFNTTNSPLATNTITDIHVDPNSNSVFFSTLSGLYEYSSSSSPGREDYSDVYAYPNPVTPDYTGLITIKGLMDSSLVKIMDSGMHLVYQTRSEGGLALWDGCTLNGVRVKSGVYYVLASSGDDTSSQGDVVAKILVVN